MVGYALGIDVGTSGIRTAVVDEEGALVSMASVGHLQQNPKRIDATLWWQATQACIFRQIELLREKSVDPCVISRIAVDGTSGTMVLVDRALNPITRALMYNSKGFAAQAERIAEYAPNPHIVQGSSSALARAMVLAEDAPDAPHLLHQADFIAAKLMNCGGLSDENNALKIGYDPQRASWPDWIEALINRDLLPEVHPIGTEWQHLDPQFAADFGLSKKARVYAGTTDSIAAFLASAPLQAGVAVTSLGSTLAIKVLGRQRIDRPTVGVYAHRLGDFWLTGGASNTGGVVLAHYFSKEELVRLSKQIDPSKPTHVGYYPLLAPGERFPHNDPDFPPVLTPRPDDDVLFLQGLLEGISAIEAKCYQEISAAGGMYPHTIFSAGGGAYNPTFTHIRSRALGVKPTLAKDHEAAVGTARLALNSPSRSSAVHNAK